MKYEGRTLHLDLEQLGSTSGSGEQLYNCPKCLKPKLYWNCYRHLGGCWGCHVGYNVHSISRVCRFLSTSHAPQQLDAQPPQQENTHITSQLPPEAWAFLIGDKKVLPWLVENHFKWDYEKQRLAVPVYSAITLEQHPDTLIFRDLAGGWRNGVGVKKEETVWVNDAFKKSDQYQCCLWIVEGVFDALSILGSSFHNPYLEDRTDRTTYEAVMALCGSEPYPHQCALIYNWYESRLNAGRMPYIAMWFDPDKAGQAAAIKLRHKLVSGYGVKPEHIVNYYEILKHFQIPEPEMIAEPNDLSQQNCKSATIMVSIYCSALWLKK